jgi:transcriptional regulator with XRE-family HTH domain
VDNRVEVREFLTSRRARLTPEQVGLAVNGVRRVPGLRRGEVAARAGVSVEYYSRLERGALAGVSASVLDGIARALGLDPAERAYLFDLARAADGACAVLRSGRSHVERWTVRPALQWALDAMVQTPAIVVSAHMDLLAANLLGRALYSDAIAGTDRSRPVNFARFAFVDHTAKGFYLDWDAAADVAVAILRTAVGRDPNDKGLDDLVGELSTASEEFRRRWRAQNVRIHGCGTKHFRHHVVGDLHLAYETVDLQSEPGLTMTVYSAEPGSTNEDGLRLLTTWATSPAILHLAIDR